MDEPKQGIHMLPLPDKYGQKYFLVHKPHGEWIAEGEKNQSYTFAYDPRNPTINWMPYFNLIPLSEKQLDLVRSSVDAEIDALRVRKSFLEHLSQSQPKCTEADLLAGRSKMTMDIVLSQEATGRQGGEPHSLT